MTQRIDLDYESIHELSLSIMRQCDEDDHHPVECAAACSLTLGRVASEKALTPQEEIAFIEYIGELTQLYFAKGAVH